jgi:pimeloyl-ACP methyl ester carboxylesterase
MQAVTSRPIYLHGLEGSPQGLKASWMAERFGSYAPSMPAHAGRPDAFDASLAVALEAVTEYPPNLIVGSSFGGALLMRLALDGHWRGPSIFLAQAGVAYGLGDRLPAGSRAILIHARQDSLIPFEHSQRLADKSGPLVELWATDGEHGLHHILKDGLFERAVRALIDP